MAKKRIIWDWNGTILNDVHACLCSINSMLEQRRMTLLTTYDYKDVFTFPVQDYYKSIGFDFINESFDKLAIEYIDLYKKKAKASALQMGAVEALSYFNEAKYEQIILSASEQVALEKQVEQHNISRYFEAIIGMDNIHAKSKLENAMKYFHNAAQDFTETILIGDTYHDYEVAQTIGAQCILVDNGHQNLRRFTFESDVRIIRDLSELTEIVNNESLIMNNID